jgi:hypothetical protein
MLMGILGDSEQEKDLPEMMMHGKGGLHEGEIQRRLQF